jgi:hypothetical protein
VALCRESCTTHQPSPPERTSFVPIDATAIVGSQMNESPSSAPSVHNQQTPSRCALDQYDWSNTLAGRLSCPEPFPKHLGLDQLRSEPNRWYVRQKRSDRPGRQDNQYFSPWLNHHHSLPRLSRENVCFVASR